MTNERRDQSRAPVDPNAAPAGGAGSDSDSKLTRSKLQWAAERRFLSNDAARGAPRGALPRLPPGQHVVQQWPLLDLNGPPAIDPARWRLEIFGQVRQPIALDWARYQALPHRTIVSDIHCVTTWSRFDNAWRGWPIRDLLAIVEPLPTARFVLLHSYDGYTTNLPLDDFAADDALLAHEWQGQPIPIEHGGPLRVVIPRRYFWKSAKWVERIELRETDAPGFWEQRGYHRRGDPWAEERYADD